MGGQAALPGSHRGRRRAPASSIPSRISVSSAASIAVAESDPLAELARLIGQNDPFGGNGPAKGGSPAGISPVGAYDMEGNVREWCWNAVGTRIRPEVRVERAILLHDDHDVANLVNGIAAALRPSRQRGQSHQDRDRGCASSHASN